MNLASNFILNIYSIAILATIYFYSQNQNEKLFLQQKLYLAMLQTTILLLVFDTFSRFDGNPNTIFSLANQGGNFVVFALSPVLPCLWLLYVHYEIFRDETRTKRLMKPLFLLATMNLIGTIHSLFFNWFYYIDEENIYHRGPYFWVPAALTFFLIFAAFLIVVFNRNKIEKKHYFSLVFFAVPPFLCINLQLIVYGLSLILNGLTLSILVVFITIQNRKMDTDYLTGVYNRKKLESYLKYKISSSTEQKTFAAILIDLNNFKSINDTYGHDIGDNALETSVVLLRSCLRSNDFIARYGGDEFYIILNVSSYADLEQMVGRIHCSLETYNANPNKSYSLGFSMGYAVYDFHSRMKADEFQKQIDLLMYADKRSKKFIS